MKDELIAKKLEALQNDSDFIEQLNRTGSMEEISQLLSEKGIDISPEELESIRLQTGPEGELDEQELQGVAGGLRIISPIGGPAWLLWRWIIGQNL